MSAVKDQGLRLLEARESAVRVGLSEWARGIPDVSVNWPHIDRYIRSEAGLAWPTADLKQRGASYHGTFQWCGAFAAYCWGTELQRGIRYRHMASTYRIHKWAKANGRIIYDGPAFPGDIALVGPTGDKQKPYGRHVCLVLEQQGHWLQTVEGNGSGLLPTGALCKDGVVINLRPLTALDPSVYAVQTLIRFAVEDLS